VIFGAVVSSEETDTMHVTVIATGFDHTEREIYPDFGARRREPEPVAHPVSQPVAEPAMFAASETVPETVERSEVNLMTVGVTTGAHGLNLDIPTFLRKQLD